MSAATYTLKPCPFSRLPGKHELKVVPLNLGESFSEVININRSAAHQVICSCMMSGPIGRSYDEAIRRYNAGLT